jgi:MinD-like ATPase involved in chromosome partitioning or flagellar assembly
MGNYLSIYEVAKKLKVSHTTIYNKLKDKEVYNDLEPFIKKIKNTRYISIEGLEILRKYFKEINTSMNEKKEFNYDSLKEEFIKNLQDRIKHLESEIETKNKHIETQAKLIENSQVLLKDSQNLLKQLKKPKRKFLSNLLKKTEKNN